jgi:hypothetical protein
MNGQTNGVRLSALVAALVFFLSVEITPLAAFAQQSPGGASGATAPGQPASSSSTSPSSQTSLPAGLNLDLSSSQASVAANNCVPVSIHVGGKLGASGLVTGGSVQTIIPGQPVTPAMFAAIQQVMSSGAQSIILSSAGSGLAGHVDLTPAAVSSLSGLTVPSGVSVVGVGFVNASPLNVTGTAQIGGNFYAL